MSTESTEYRCKDCNTLMKPDDKECPKCGSKNRNIQLTVKENLALKEEVHLSINKVKADLDNLYQPLKKSTNYCAISFLIILGVLTISFFININYFDGSTLVPSSVGMLTFVSVFYTLLISKEGKTILKNIKEIISEKEDSYRKCLKELAENTKNIEELGTQINKIYKELNKHEVLKNWLDLDYLLIFIVTCFIISTVLGMFSYSANYFASYLAFSFGISMTIALIIFWRILNKVNEKYTTNR